MNTLIFFHGFGSNGSSKTAELIKATFPELNVLAPLYNTKNADEAVASLTKIVNEVLESEDTEKMYLVGNSLGSFFANYFSNKHRKPVVIINPSLDPANNLEKYNPAENVDCESFKKYYTTDEEGVEKIVVLGKLDDVIPYETFMERFENRFQIFLNESMGHRVTSIEEIKPAINKLINNF